jgi:hypothetical protein
LKIENGKTFTIYGLKNRKIEKCKLKIETNPPVSPFAKGGK